MKFVTYHYHNTSQYCHQNHFHNLKDLILHDWFNALSNLLQNFIITLMLYFELMLMVISCQYSRYYRFVDPPQPKLNRSNQSTGNREYRPSAIPRNPIITVTEHTPTPSPDFMRRQVG